MYTTIRTCVCIYLQLYRTCLCIYFQLYAHVYVFICIRTYLYTHTRTHRCDMTISSVVPPLSASIIHTYTLLTYAQTETGGHMITPLPGATPLKPGSASLPFFGIKPVVLDSDVGIIIVLVFVCRSTARHSMCVVFTIFWHQACAA
jgi:hypothetical protein